ncbi:MAG TPA: heme-binding protein [Ktedonobacteraceae bacterium]|nr:heme-binding protein [Ktedonobacteraceae bacterium]
MSISIEVARRVMEACKRRAHELRSPVSIAIVDAGGHLVLFERMMAPYGWATGNISIAKASTAVMFNQSTDAVAQWGSGIPGFAASMASMSQGKFIMAAGGWPIRQGGTTVGGIGVSGGNAPGRDDDIARAGLAALEAAMAPHSSYAPPAQPGQAQQPLQPAPAYPTISQAQAIPLQQGASFSAPKQPVGSTYLDNNEDYVSGDEQILFDDEPDLSRGGQP